MSRSVLKIVLIPQVCHARPAGYATASRPGGPGRSGEQDPRVPGLQPQGLGDTGGVEAALAGGQALGEVGVLRQAWRHPESASASA